ncbi:MAG: carboxypeptidase-like regulatory domain-containing protein [Acidobacteria bacterium]|nr:carboxypeptidase-like regulatory domain-containing protein [Acidobacteriota bacterium]
MKVKALVILSFLLLVLAVPSFAEKKNKEDAGKRSVQGVVTDSANNLVDGAVVQLKNTKTLQVVSFITQKDGSYRFHGLNTDYDYQLKADHDGATSGNRTLSSFDSRPKAIINLKISK